MGEKKKEEREDREMMLNVARSNAHLMSILNEKYKNVPKKKNKKFQYKKQKKN